MKKLVRDLIPQVIPEDKISMYKFSQAEITEYKHYLNDKLLEEVKEFLEAENIEELADIFEVIEAIIKHHKFNKDEIRKVQTNKKETRGGFEKRLVMEKV